MLRSMQRAGTPAALPSLGGARPAECTPPAFLQGARLQSLRPAPRRLPLRQPARALVNVDFGPGLILGTVLIGSGIVLYQVRTVRPEVSRDSDVFFSSLGLLCGGILVFQGWRLDPILFFGQLLTAGTAVSFAVETIKLRGEVEEARGGTAAGQPDRRRSRRRANGVRLPPAGAASYGSWTGRADEEERRGAGGDEFEAAFDAARREERSQKTVQADPRDLWGATRGSADDDWE